MSRSGYSDDCDDDILAYGRWRGIIASTCRGKTGQAFLHELVQALEAMPEKRLIREDLRKDGEVCALGAVGAKRRMKLEALDPEDSEIIASEFGISTPLAQEIVYRNDEYCEADTPEERWTHIHAWAKGLLVTGPDALQASSQRKE